MKRLAAVLLVFAMAACAIGADIYDAVPEDSTVVVVVRDYRASLEALKSFLDAAAPNGSVIPQTAKEACLPFLTDIINERASVGGYLKDAGAPGLAADKPAALAVIAWGRGSSGIIVARSADEAAWRAANAKRIDSDAKTGREVIKSKNGGCFEFADGYLITADSAATLNAYDAMKKAKALGSQRKSALQLVLFGNPIAVNVSAPTIARVWQNARGTLCDDVAAKVFGYTRGLTSGGTTVVVPASVPSKLLYDLAAYGDEMYFGVTPSAENLVISGQVFLRPLERFSSIVIEQKTSAPDPGAMASGRPSVGMAMSFEGDVFWQYAKGFIPPLTAGMAGTERSPASLELMKKLADGFRDSVGLKNVALLWMPGPDWRYPEPVLVAQAPDAAKAVDMLAGAVTEAYRDTLLVSYYKTLGFRLGEPTVEVSEASGRHTATIKLPFKTSSEEGDPVKGARMKAILGDSFIWRITAVTEGSRQAVVMGNFAGPGALDEFVAHMKIATEAPRSLAEDGAQTPAGRTLFAGFVDLPAYSAGLVKGLLRYRGEAPRQTNVPTAGKPCAVTISSDGEPRQLDQLHVSIRVPSQQVRASFTAINNVLSSISAASKEPSAACDTRTGRKAGRGGDTEDSEAEPSDSDQPRRPWGRH